VQQVPGGRARGRAEVCVLQRPHREQQGPLDGPVHSPTVGSWEGAVSYERGTHVGARLSGDAEPMEKCEVVPRRARIEGS